MLLLLFSHALIVLRKLLHIAGVLANVEGW